MWIPSFVNLNKSSKTTKKLSGILTTNTTNYYSSSTQTHLLPKTAKLTLKKDKYIRERKNKHKRRRVPSPLSSKTWLVMFLVYNLMSLNMIPTLSCMFPTTKTYIPLPLQKDPITTILNHFQRWFWTFFKPMSLKVGFIKNHLRKGYPSKKILRMVFF